MAREITRRDFLNGVAVAAGSLLPAAHAQRIDTNIFVPQPPPGHGPDPSAMEPLLARGITPQDPRYYPPALLGMRGSHPGSFEAAHAVRDAAFWKTAGNVRNTGEEYDLVVVGAGISGLSAAHFYRARAGAEARILILDNHDDFGGHAKRNEVHIGGRMLLMNGGTMSIDSPYPYSAVANGLLRSLGVDPPALSKECEDPGVYSSLGLRPGVFFDKETFGADRLAVGNPGGGYFNKGARPTVRDWERFLDGTPLSEDARKDIVRLETADADYMAGLTSAQKKDRLRRISYKDFLLRFVKVHPQVIAFYQTRTNGEWGVGIDAMPALDMWAFGMPGFQGMHLEPGVTPHMTYTAAGYYSTGGSYTFHYPDGNASIARLLVRDLIPEAMPGHTAKDIVTARANYARLDRPGSGVRIRLNSPVVRVRHLGDPATAKQVEIAYASGGKVHTVKAKGVVLACWNTMIPWICPSLPADQKEALGYLVKVPLVYTTVGLRDWTAFHRLGVSHVGAPGSYFTDVSLNSIVNIGDYRSPSSPDEPTLLHLTRTPCRPGLSMREQYIAGRMELFNTPFATFERNIRDQLGRMLAGGGFDPERDIEAIIVNRWSHGYGYEYDPLFDPDWPHDARPNVIGRKPFGRITIANSDSGATAYTDVAIDQAHRAVGQLLAGESAEAAGNHRATAARSFV
ncbi:MAG TPA: NAD(P)-binding protein [Steroidobacteraceae bacterium]|nr:NAD(P)-binding protein [Steroidobacteraceae bacterium]